MARVEYAADADLPVEAIWDYVQEMDHWAHHMPGYQKHEKRSQDLSVWTLKGDVGVLTRTLTFEVHVEEWNGPERVRFRLKGLNEPMTGEGVFQIEGTPSGDAGPAAQPKRENALVRALAAVLRRLRRLFGGGAPERARVEPGGGAARLFFRLELVPGGPMAPMIEAMIKPAMVVAAEELSQKILADVETRQASV